MKLFLVASLLLSMFSSVCMAGPAFGGRATIGSSAGSAEVRNAPFQTRVSPGERFDARGNTFGSVSNPVGGGMPQGKLTCPCSCSCAKNAAGKCPTECLVGIEDGSSTPKELK